MGRDAESRRGLVDAVEGKDFLEVDGNPDECSVVSSASCTWKVREKNELLSAFEQIPSWVM